MKRHKWTIILLLLAVVSFVLQFLTPKTFHIYCDFVAFLLPTIAALVEMALSERSEKATESEIKRLKDNQLSVRVEDNTLVFDKGIEIKQ